MGKMKKISFSNMHSKIEHIYEYHTDSGASLNAYYRFDPIKDAVPAKFIGYSREEIDRELKERKETLDRMCSLELLAAIEAHIRIDYIIRGQDKLRDDFSKKMREVFDKKENRASLADEILLVWKREKPEHKTRLDNLGKALDYRNWLAHGRYLFPKKHSHINKYDYLSIYALAEDALSSLELIEA